jgi:hypothetical protein
MLLKLRVTQNSNPIAPTKSIIFKNLRPFCPVDPIAYTLFSIAYGRTVLSGDPIANTPSAPAVGRSQFRVEHRAVSIRSLCKAGTLALAESQWVRQSESAKF